MHLLLGYPETQQSDVGGSSDRQGVKFQIGVFPPIGQGPPRIKVGLLP